ncbi:MAG: DUF192 domain-containing protein [Kiritimatiellae bacterium]|nr:DUF192 domain-containing protein [Kiritimatiellia bacterium]
MAKAVMTIELHGVRAKVARTLCERMRGLIGSPPPPLGEGLLIEKCNAIHTLFMQYPITAVFLDKRREVVKIVRDIKPWRLFVWGGWRARSVLELSIGTPLRFAR